MQPDQCYGDNCPSPLGELWLVADGEGALLEVNFREGRYGSTDRSHFDARYERLGKKLQWGSSQLGAARSALGEYFDGQRRIFDLPLNPQGTAFQQRVWQGLLRIPYGSTCSYGALASSIGQPTASRAVGLANGKNPISILIPCHRVIGSDGSLTGYGGGLDKKEALLRLEGSLMF